ncbi:hypothetical protein KIPB_000720 [Kipferlia bialata]|uniref:PDEase domain-containing protein n=1 Tax=Kipferlia bialata TaxID=797122 RepID=A0A9K3CPH3_9EUKA|nr:hypothetical protein KIPB_000720 [Kipferlia bialata]|eukprot:g720.t1
MATESTHKQLARAMTSIEFDAHSFEESVGAGSFIYLFLYVFVVHKYHVLTQCTLKDVAEYLLYVRSLSHHCPFTNWVHTLDMLQIAVEASSRFHTQPHTAALMTPTCRFLLLLAVVSRNIDRAGFSRDYIANTMHPLASLHGSEAPYENQASSVMLSLLRHFGLLRKLPLWTEPYLQDIVRSTNVPSIDSLRYIVRGSCVCERVPGAGPAGDTHELLRSLHHPESVDSKGQLLLGKVIAAVATIGSGVVEAKAGLIVPLRRKTLVDPKIIMYTCQLEFSRDTVIPYLASVRRLSLRDKIECLAAVMLPLLKQAIANRDMWETLYKSSCPD